MAAHRFAGIHSLSNFGISNSSIFLTCITPRQSSTFSTSVPKHAGRKDGNRKRGVSALRRTGPKHVLSVAKEPLPMPVTDASRRSKIPVRDDHGLWQFFGKDRKAMVLPEVEYEFGRAWTVAELRNKSFNDLHRLWWLCAKEKNRISTQEYERRRVKAGFGEAESEERMKTVRQTQKAIKHALTLRWYKFNDEVERRKSELPDGVNWNGPLPYDEVIMDSNDYYEDYQEEESATEESTYSASEEHKKS